MRNFILVLLLALPPLVACGAAYAKATVEIGKPICSHYDDSAKSSEPRAASEAQTDAAAPAAPAPAVATATTAAIPSPTVSAKGGGAPGMTRTRSAPRWQTFLPGMFR